MRFEYRFPGKGTIINRFGCAYLPACESVGREQWVRATARLQGLYTAGEGLQSIRIPGFGMKARKPDKGREVRRAKNCREDENGRIGAKVDEATN